MTGHLLYTEEDVELVRAAVVKALAKPGELSLGRTVLDALAAAGRLLPPGSEVREEWGVIVHARYGDLWIGRGDRQSAEREAESAAGRYTFPREVGVRKIIWTPPVPDTEPEG